VSVPTITLPPTTVPPITTPPIEIPPVCLPTTVGQLVEPTAQGTVTEPFYTISIAASPCLAFIGESQAFVATITGWSGFAGRIHIDYGDGSTADRYVAQAPCNEWQGSQRHATTETTPDGFLPTHGYADPGIYTITVTFDLPTDCGDASWNPASQQPGAAESVQLRVAVLLGTRPPYLALSQQP
jgi:hypothetical protein